MARSECGAPEARLDAGASDSPIFVERSGTKSPPRYKIKNHRKNYDKHLQRIGFAFDFKKNVCA